MKISCVWVGGGRRRSEWLGCYGKGDKMGVGQH